MSNKVVDILTSFETPEKVCAMGNEAIARGALETGVNGVFSYPGTPSTEISEIFNHISDFQAKPANQEKYPQLCAQPVYFEYSINEKIALEKAIAYSIGNKSALCIMKNVGMNVASDALMSITYQTIVAPVVIVLCDDPGCHSSSNEQDSRYWGQMASVPVFNPATPEESHAMVKDAFKLSGELKLPVIVRMTTRVSHTRGILHYNAISSDVRDAHFDRLPEHINIPARTATAHQKLLDKLHSETLEPFFSANNKVSGGSDAKLGIISSGVVGAYMREILNRNDLNVAVLELGLIYPFPENDVLDFLNRDFDTILVLEELDPIIENSVRTLAQKNSIGIEILGKGYSGLSPTGEFSLEQIRDVIAEFSGIDCQCPEALPEIETVAEGLPPRPPALCAGCPHRATFYALKLSVPREAPLNPPIRGEKEVLPLGEDLGGAGLVMCGDIGCFGLGALPPLKMIDTINHMGMSVSMAQGLSEALSAPSNSPIGGEQVTEYFTADPSRYAFLKERSESHRNNPTEAERIAWELLRANKADFHIRRQHIIGSYIVDFVNIKTKTVIEIDGDIHDYQKEEDTQRTNWLEEKGFEVIRFKNEKVIGDPDGFIKEVKSALAKRESISSPNGGGREGAKTVAMLGDGTFFHSGVASLLNAVYTKSNVLVIIFDNRTTGMTGGQDHPGANQREQKYKEVQIEPLVRGMGIPVETISPFNLKDTFEKINRGVQAEGVSVIISKAPCIFVPDFSNTQTRRKVWVDKNKCNTCANHADLGVACSRRQSPQTSLARAKAKIEADVSINAERQACPANICNHGFFNSILEGDYKTAVDIVRDKMLFARTCGDICHRPCELFASEGNGEVVPIKQLKKYVTSMEEHTMDFANALSRATEAEPKGKKVAVVGAGPAGLSACYDLIQQGYEVTLFDKEEKVGGLVRFAIPDFRMDKTDFNFEANMLKELGVKFELGMALGKDISVEQLSVDYDAVLLAIGVSKPKVLDSIDKNIPYDKRTNALDFLKAYNTQTADIPSGSTILVIGGGNSAMDAARSAKHLDNSNRVIVSCIETKENMPAFDEEIEHAMEEGIELIPDSEAHPQPLPPGGEKALAFSLKSYSNKEDLQTLEADYVIVAIGQDTETEVLNGTELDDTNRVTADDKTGKTTAENVFVAGDLCSGNHMSVIGAIASGKRAATGIRQLLEGYEYDYEGAKALHLLNTKQPKGHLSMQVEMSDQLLKEITHFDLFQACQKCNHCIDNFGCPALVKVNGKIELDETKCTHCGLCIDVCPNGAIQWEDEKEMAMS